MLRPIKIEVKISVKQAHGYPEPTLAQSDRSMTKHIPLADLPVAVHDATNVCLREVLDCMGAAVELLEVEERSKGVEHG